MAAIQIIQPYLLDTLNLANSGERKKGKGNLHEW